MKYLYNKLFGSTPKFAPELTALLARQEYAREDFFKLDQFFEKIADKNRDVRLIPMMTDVMALLQEGKSLSSNPTPLDLQVWNNRLGELTKNLEAFDATEKSTAKLLVYIRAYQAMFVRMAPDFNEGVKSRIAPSASAASLMADTHRAEDMGSQSPLAEGLDAMPNANPSASPM